MRKTFFIVWLFLFIFSTPTSWATCLKCNVILISLDTVGAKHVSPETTPNLIQFSKQARQYLNAHSPSPWTAPAHASMLSGLLPWHTGLLRAKEKMSDHVETMAEVLRSNKYDTKAITDGIYVRQEFGLAQGFQSFEVLSIPQTPKHFDLTAQTALTFIAKKRTSPFFLFLHSYDAHATYLPSEKSFSSLGGKGKPQHFGQKESLDLLLNDKTPSTDEADRIRLSYQANLKDLDEKLGTFLRALKEKNLLRNTIVIITSDHGEELGEHQSWGQHSFTLFEEVLHIPLMVYEPNGVGREISAPVSLVDLFPSVLAMLELKKIPTDGEILPAVDGQNFMDRPLFAIATTDKKGFIQLAGHIIEKKIPPTDWPKLERNEVLQLMTLRGNKKLLLNLSEGTQVIYHLSVDPLEQRPVASPCDEACGLQQALLFHAGLVK